MFLTIFGSNFQIIFTSDLHETLFKNGYGPAGFAEYLEKNGRENLLILDAGDLFDSKLQLPFFGDHRNHTLDYIKKVKYDAMVLGNHEFYFSREWLENYKKTNKSLLGANVKGLKPYEIFVLGDLRIAVIGLTTPQHVANQVEHYGMLPEDPLKALRRIVNDLPEVDFIICLAHLQHELDRKIIESFPQIDLLLSGHDHRGPELVKINDSYIFEGKSRADSIYTLNVNTEEKLITYEQLKIPTADRITYDDVKTAAVISIIIGILSMAWLTFNPE